MPEILVSYPLEEARREILKEVLSRFASITPN
jgi:hypothetical protein